MSFLAPKMPAMPAMPAAPPPPPAFGAIQGSKPGKKPMTPTFLGAQERSTAAGPTLMGGGQTNKTLMGQ